MWNWTLAKTALIFASPELYSIKKGEMTTKAQSRYVTTSDGVRLHYLEAGTGKPLVLIHGWSQCAEEFKHQIAGLSDRYRVIAIDQRGHGDSEKPGFGYKIQRLSKDLHDLLVALDLRDVTVLGHSMGCSVIWCYWDLFGADRLAKIILVDEPPFLTSNPAWTPAETEAAGPIFHPPQPWKRATPWQAQRVKLPPAR